MDNASSESLYIGIVSGILTSGLIYLAITFFEKVLIPWYQALIYRGVDIGGEWEVTAEKVVTQSGVINIEQKAHKIKGNAIWVSRDPSNTIAEGIRTFDLDGQISERFVTFIIKHKDKRRLGISNYLLQVTKDGRTMEGTYSLYDIEDSNIYSTSVVLTRKEK